MNTLTSLLRRHQVLSFCILTLGLSFAAYFLPFPAESRALGYSMLIVFIPVTVAAILTALDHGSVKNFLGQVLQWRIGLKRFLQILMLCLVIRFGVTLLAFVFGWVPSLQLGEFVPFLIMVYVFAAGEELGWRGFALPRLLQQHSPLAASLLIGVPWAALHLILLLPGMLSIGTPPVPQFIVILALSVMLTWAYRSAGKNGVCAAVFLHGTQNLLAFFNAHVELTQATWLMALTYSIAAIILIASDVRVWLREPIHAAIATA
jgi:uncharacterized protein